MTMQLVSTVTVGAGGAASIEFTSIPQTGTDLLVVLSGRGSTSYVSFAGKFNNNTSTIYSSRYLYGTGSATGSGTESAVAYASFGDGAGTRTTANTFSNHNIYIPNYAGSANKSWSVESVDEHNGTEAYQEIWAGLWASTSPITSLIVFTRSGTFAQYSTASLYTITKGSGGATVS